jgi:hypothetical protein
MIIDREDKQSAIINIQFRVLVTALSGIQSYGFSDFQVKFIPTRQKR